MPTQKAIAEKIRKKRADYVLSLKENQAGLYEDVALYFGDEQMRQRAREDGGYISTEEKAHGQMEKRHAISLRPIKYLEEVLSF